ncbi:MAG TPA: acetyl-CoA carboxylase biotin carboxyl carrier protein, partial [Nitrospiria bacterium]
QGVPQTSPQQTEQSEKPGLKTPSPEEEGLITLNSPVVGTFFRAPAPDADPYAEVGDQVKKGDVLCIIEAMKLMNEIESECDGKIVAILVENAQAVEYGEPLFRIEPGSVS